MRVNKTKFERNSSLEYYWDNKTYQAKVQVAQARNMSIDEHCHCCLTFEISGFVTYENERISKKKLTLLKMCVTSAAPVWSTGRFMAVLTFT